MKLPELGLTETERLERARWRRARNCFCALWACLLLIGLIAN